MGVKVMKKEIKVFVVSPSDVKKEREIVREICLELNSIIDKDIVIKPILWEYHPFYYLKNPQENILNEFLSADIYIVILWQRIGDNIEGLKGAITKEENVTGTQFEIEQLLYNKKKSVYIFRKVKNVVIPRENSSEFTRQIDALDSFLEKIGAFTNNYSNHTFKTTKEFKKRFREQFKTIIENIANIKIELPNYEYKDKNIINDINPSYLMGLYVFIIFLAVSIFLYFKEYGKLLFNIQSFILFFVLNLMVISLMGIKLLTTNNKKYKKLKFKEIVLRLLRRGTFIIFFTFMLAIIFWLSLMPLLEDIVNYLKSI